MEYVIAAVVLLGILIGYALFQMGRRVERERSMRDVDEALQRARRIVHGMDR